MLLTNKRVGLWSWALTGPEAATAIAITRARQESQPVAPDVAARYAAMMAKQRKLAARSPRRAVERPSWRL